MARFSRIKRAEEEEPELNMIPIMNLFMVLIPFLLTSVSFLHIKAVNTSIPIHSDTTPKQVEEKVSQKITIVLELQADKVRISTLSDTPNELKVSENEWIVQRSDTMDLKVVKVANRLKQLKLQYPSSDTMILIPDNDVTYQEIIQTMDCARSTQSEALFPNVVLSGSMG
jgi:biopolymer transport protein ExbD